MVQFEHQDPNKPWTRIKLSDLSFNALRVAMVDPTARMRASASLPRAIPRVRGITITGDFLHEEKIQSSDNLNCLIGGRSTGKSTAIRAIAYAFGLNDEFGDFDNCPDSVTVFCEDENGIIYRYVRTRGGDIEVKAKEDTSIIDIPIDAFRIEYFGQGELAKVAEEENLSVVVGTQSKLASEKTVRETIQVIATEYTNGFSRSGIQRDFDQIIKTAGTCTRDDASNKSIEVIKATLLANNATVTQKELELNKCSFIIVRNVC